VILSWNGVEIKNASKLQRVVREMAIGATAKIEVLRGKEKISLDVKIEARGEAPPPPPPPSKPEEEKKP